MSKRSLCALALTSALLLAAPASAATLVLLNGDAGTGTGLDDPTAKAPQGLNPGTTLGEQRRIAYQFAMDLWGSVLTSNVPVKIGASFQPLACTPTSGVLGSAGANWIDRDFPNAPIAGLWYSAALADSLAGVDLDPDPADPADIVSRFNGDLGVNPNCLTGLDWYYGLDGVTPANSINFLNVVMHEIGHGLGFQGFLNKSTGAFGNFDGTGPRSDAYTQNAFDNIANLGFNNPASTPVQRALAMRSPGRTVWTGTLVNSEAGLVLDNRTVLNVTAPAAAAGSYEIGFAAFGPLATPANFPANQVVLINDGAGASVSDGCETPFANAAAIGGKIALIDRGTCGFAVKVKNAQLNGAVAVVVANNAAGVLDMGGADATITIPSVLVSLANGTAFKANAPVTARVLVDPALLQGADNSGRVRLYSPAVVAAGSTFSHYDTALAPNALMEPAITASLQAQYNVDLTPALYRDMGWQVNNGNAKIGNCDTGIDVLEAGGLIIGANVQASERLCRATTDNQGQYLRCIVDLQLRLRADRLVTPIEAAGIQMCAARNRLR